jgi:hypothetical protein
MAGWVAGAVAISAGLGAYSASSAADKQAKAAKDAADKQAQSAQASIDSQNAALDKQIALNQPWQDAGLKALGKYADNPAFKFGAEDFTASPSYQFRQQEGVNSLDMSASSRGKLLSGAQDKAITNYGQNLASEEYGNAYNQALQNYNTNQNTQLNIANIGRGAAGQTQSAIQSNSQGVSNALLQNGNNQAQAQYAMGNAYATGAQGMTTALNQGVGNALYMYNKGK